MEGEKKSYGGKNSLDILFKVCKYSGFTSVITMLVTVSMGLLVGVAIMPVFVISMVTLGIGTVGYGAVLGSNRY